MSHSHFHYTRVSVSIILFEPWKRASQCLISVNKRMHIHMFWSAGIEVSWCLNVSFLLYQCKRKHNFIWTMKSGVSVSHFCTHFLIKNMCIFIRLCYRNETLRHLDSSAPGSKRHWDAFFLVQIKLCLHMSCQIDHKWC